jgi:hypothetical protein
VIDIRRPLPSLFAVPPYAHFGSSDACPMPTFSFVAQSHFIAVANGGAFANSFDLMDLLLQFD